MLRAWAESDGRGLSELCRTEGQRDGLVDLNKVVRPEGGERLSILEHLLSALRESEPNVLIPFGLDQAHSSPRPITRQLLQRSMDLRMLTRRGEKIEDARQAPPLRTALNTILDEVTKDIRREGATIAQARRLQEAILNVALPLTLSFPKQETEFISSVRGANSAVKDGFRTKLSVARRHFTASSVIDIRGCLVGKDKDYLRAVAQFFGRERIKPHISAPDLFTGYPLPGSRPIPDNEETQALAEEGVASQLGHWTGVITGHRATTRPDERMLNDYIFPNAGALPVPTGETVKLYYGTPGDARHLERWLISQWDPSVPDLARSLAQKWARTAKATAQVCTLSDAGEDQVFVLPDPRYDEHIVTL
jgi:hypothetical protein